MCSLHVYLSVTRGLHGLSYESSSQLQEGKILISVFFLCEEGGLGLENLFQAWELVNHEAEVHAFVIYLYRLPASWLHCPSFVLEKD